jgi:hypothetical protein
VTVPETGAPSPRASTDNQATPRSRSATIPFPAAAATLFLIGGALIGAGAGALFKWTTGLVLAAAAPEDRLAMTSQLPIALFVGLSIPVIGAGVALTEGASAPDTVLGFASLVSLGVAGAGALLGSRFEKGN